MPQSSSSPPGENGGVDNDEEEEVKEKRTASAHVVYRAIIDEADEELERSAAALGWSGLAAGLSMGFSLIAEAALRQRLPDAPWRPLVSKFGYCVGFLIVVLGRQQLFTENTLTPILPLLRDRSAQTFWKVARLWVIVLATNLIGTFLFALVVAKSNAFTEQSKAQFVEIGKEAVAAHFWTVVLRGIFAGWLLALMVWLLPVAETGRIAVIVVLTYLIGIGGMTHVIAGSLEAFYLAIAGVSTWGRALGGFILPALIGNVIGGTAIVAALSHGQAAEDKDGKTPAKQGRNA